MNPKLLNTCMQVREILAGMDVGDSVAVATMVTVAAVASLQVALESTGLQEADDELAFIDQYYNQITKTTKDQVRRLRASIASGELVLPSVTFDAVA